MALNGLICADVSLSNYSLTHCFCNPVLAVAMGFRVDDIVALFTHMGSCLFPTKMVIVINGS